MGWTTPPSKLEIHFTRNVLLFSHKTIPKIKRLWRFKNLYIFVPNGVFNPIYSLTTSFIAENLPDVRDKKVLDIGCGSGALALVAKIRGAELVIGYDESPLAIASSNINAKLNGLEAFFTNKKKTVAMLSPYQVIITNPPYLPLEPRHEIDKLWSSGSDQRFLLRMIALSRMLIDRRGVFTLGFSSITGLSLRQVLELLRRTGFKVIGFRSKKYLRETLYVFYSIPR